jgi:anti-sigma regulatory factor (Ser/Thr protein kinase)
MRWRSSETTSGRWPGKPLQSCAETTTGGSDADEIDFRLPVWMQAALGKTVPLERRQVAGVAGATYRLHVAPWALPAALRDLKRVRRIAAGDPDHVRGAIGIGTGRAVYLMIVTTSGDAIERLRAHPEHRRVLERWGDRLWLSTWEPEAEFGQWHKVRLRDGQLASERPVVDVTLAMQPEAAKRARDVLRANLSGIGPERLGMLELLTSEVVGNSFRHGRLNSTDPIRLQIAAKGEWLRIAVIDRGRKFEPRVPTAKFSTDQSGWGLYIVDKTTDRWGIFTRQNERHFWFELRLSSLDCAPPDSA